MLENVNAAVSQMMTRTKSGPPGLNGGLPGRCGRSYLNYGENSQRIIGGTTPENSWQMSLFSNFPLKSGDAYTAECPGGGGWGDLLDRDPEAVLDDVRDGFVSPQSAQREYGVIFDEERDRVDYAATKELRRKIRSAKP